ncbi:MAG: HAMP domain-containing histidine kinase [Pseudomonadota bacterium]|nr:HAMP domain-containing histidine kinase [Pseudomonadota bacterium]
MTRPRRRLRHRLMLAFAGFTLAVTALFGLYAVAFVYSVEDEFFEAMLQQEAAAQLAQHARHGRWDAPRSGFMSIHADTGSMPDDLRAQHRAEPWRVEFPGNAGRHYHLLPLDPQPPAARAYLVAEVSEQLVVRPIRDDIFALLAWSALGVIALALLLGYWLARRTAAPLADLAARVGEMQPGRLPDGLAERYPDDEIGVLARGLQALIDRVRTFIAREQEFTRDASHELRTPLTVIRSAAERLASEPALSSEAGRQIDHVRESVRQLEQTVTLLLSLAREDRPDVIGSGPTALLPAIERVVVEQAPLLDDKPVTVEVAVPRDAVITLPAGVLHILLSNLIGNAFAHTRQGRIAIDLHADRLRIINSGGGLADPVRDEAFQAFNKGPNSTGSGLGLAIVQRLCDRYGLELRIESDSAATTASIALSVGD